MNPGHDFRAVAKDPFYILKHPSILQVIQATYAIEIQSRSMNHILGQSLFGEKPVIGSMPS